MRQNTKKRLLIGIIILLILMNLSALVTFSYNKINNKREYKEYHNKNFNKKNPHIRMKEFVKEELNLDEKQFEIYCNLKNKNIQNTKVYVDKIQGLKRKIVLEIGNDFPDKTRLEVLSDSIGFVHKNLQTEMNQHFLEVKDILNEDQRSKLTDLMLKMDERFKIKRKHRFRGRNGCGKNGMKNRQP